MKIALARTAKWAIGFGVSVAAVAVATPSGATVPDDLEDRSREPQHVTIKVSGEEYESPPGTTLNGTGGTCPHSNNVPYGRAPCWSWTAKHLGRGVAILGVDDTEEYTLKLIDCRGAARACERRLRSGSTPNVLLGDGGPVELIPDPSPLTDVGHVNRFPQKTMVFTGTGRFKGVSGTATGEGFSRVVSFDPGTGILHKETGIELSGEFTID
jgi:hypothetical protein